MIRWLALLGCVLAGTVVAEVVAYRPGDAGLTAEQPAPAIAGHAVKAFAGEKASQDQWFTTIVSRPLFSPDRKPVAGTVNSMPRLTGIIATSDGAVAIFQPDGNGKTVVARQGDTVGEWQVTTVAASAVDLRKAAERIVLVPRFDKSQSGEAARIAAMPPPTRWEAPAPKGLLRARWSNPQLQP